MKNQEIIKYYTNCKKIFNHYGLENQKIQFIQELAELIQAISKNNPENFIEELADVQVMIDQFTINNQAIDSEVQQIQLEKVNRQINRIKGE